MDPGSLLGMLTISRFRSPGEGFADEAAPVVEWWSARPGCLSLELVRNLDEPDLWAIVGRWASAGVSRRSVGGFEAKMLLTPLLSRAIDEPSAYLPPAEVGDNRPRGETPLLG